VTAPRAGALTEVTLSATAAASAGTAEVALRSSTAVHWAPITSVLRVSISRTGTSAWKPVACGSVCTASGAGGAQPAARAVGTVARGTTAIVAGSTAVATRSLSRLPIRAA